MNLSSSTHWHRAHGRPTRIAKAVSQQYLTDEEEAVLWDFITAKRVEMASFRLRHDELRDIACLIRHSRHSSARLCKDDLERDARRPNKDWSPSFFIRMGQDPKITKRPNLARSGSADMAKLLKDLDPMVQHTKILHENVYHLLLVGGVFLKNSILRLLMKVDDMEEYLKRTPAGKVLTVVECMSLQREVLCPLIVWPVTADKHVSAKKSVYHRATKSRSGQLDTETFLNWLKQTFEPQTCIQACGRLRFLVVGRLADYCSKRITEFCQERKIVICEARGTLAKRLPSGTATYEESNALAVETLQRAYSENRNHGTDFWRNYQGARNEALEGWKKGMVDCSMIRRSADPGVNAQRSNILPEEETSLTPGANTVEQRLDRSAESRRMSEAAHFQFVISVFQHDLACMDMDEATRDRINHFVNSAKTFLAAEGSANEIINVT
jgi:hypothetical protein